LRDLGYLEGQNIAFDYAYGDGVPERLVEAAAALVRRPVDVIATYGTPASLAAKQATTTIPIVMISIGDPLRAGLVPSLADREEISPVQRQVGLGELDMSFPHSAKV